MWAEQPRAIGHGAVWPETKIYGVESLARRCFQLKQEEARRTLL